MRKNNRIGVQAATQRLLMSVRSSQYTGRLHLKLQRLKMRALVSLPLFWMIMVSIFKSSHQVSGDGG
jgi:Fe2+ transport system protein B